MVKYQYFADFLTMMKENAPATKKELIALEGRITDELVAWENRMMARLTALG